MTNKKREYIDFLKKRFDENKFIEFISDLLNLSSGDINPYVSEQKPEQKQFKNTIEYYKFIANYESNSDRIGTFIVKLTNEGSQNARTSQRTFISTLLNKYNLDASLVAFYQDNELSWRLSFVKKELSFTEKGIKVDLTPAKRFSYLVGENESVHTAQEYLFSLLDIEDRKITLSDIEKVFNVEKVTKEFFEKYKEKYLELKEFLDKNDDFATESEKCDFTSEEFAKKLMGQIVFLYFLQKKGWLGVQIVPNELTFDEYDEISKQADSVCNNLLEKYYVKEDYIYKVDKNSLKSETIKDNINNFVSIFKGTKYDKAWGTGDKKFLRNMFKKSRMDHKNNFFDDYLEPFFYTGLNEKRENQYFVLFNCKIPFLNGGLFEPINNYRWSSAQFNIPDEMFSNDNNTGILDKFDYYNFTIDEEEPLEKDIAVDPEMLGKIFENLLDVKDRKSTGSFYTPREIVHYMCKESLANYIVNKLNIPYEDIISFIKYGDILTQTDWTNIYNEKNKHILPDSIWDNLIEIDKALLDVKIADPAVGSGAFPLGILNEIVKLRDNISSYILIQEDKKIISRENISQKQLIRDTYSMKLQTIQNSIYAVDIEMSAVDIAKLRLWLSLIVDYPNDHEPRPLPNLDCKIMQGNSLIDEFEGTKLFSRKTYKKSKRKNAATVTVQKSILSEPIYVEQSFALDGTNAQEEDLFGELQRYQKQFFVNSNSSEKKIIKSKIESIQYKIMEKSFENNQKKLVKLKKLEEKRVKQWFIWELEFYDVFKNNGGFDIVIGNPPYGIVYDDIKKNYEQNYETFKRNNDLYVAFYQLSVILTNESGIISLITPNTYLNGDYFKKIRYYLKSNTKIISIIDYKSIPIFNDPTVYVAIGIYSRKKEKVPYNYSLIIAGDNINDLKETIISLRINDDEPIKNVDSLFSKIVECSDFQLQEKYDVKDVGFNYWSKGNKKQRNGGSIGDRVLYSGAKLNENDIPFLKGRNIEKYYKEKPTNYLKHNYKNYLNPNTDIFRFSSEVMTNPNKIIYRQTANKIIATIDKEKLYNDKTIHCIIPKEKIISNEYIVGLLNSRLFEFLYKEISQEEKGRAFSQVKTIYIKKLPIVIGNKEQINAIESLVNKAIEKRKQHIDIKAIERDIDKLVFEIYNLNEENINYINSYIN